MTRRNPELRPPSRDSATESPCPGRLAAGKPLIHGIDEACMLRKPSRLVCVWARVTPAAAGGSAP